MRVNYRLLHRMGDRLAPIAWYEPDTRTNFDVDQEWGQGRLSTTPNGIHYITHNPDAPGPRIWVSPDIAQWIQHSEPADDDVYRERKVRRFAYQLY